VTRERQESTFRQYRRKGEKKKKGVPGHPGSKKNRVELGTDQTEPGEQEGGWIHEADLQNRGGGSVQDIGRRGRARKETRRR